MSACDPGADHPRLGDTEAGSDDASLELGDTGGVFESGLDDAELASPGGGAHAPDPEPADSTEPAITDYPIVSLDRLVGVGIAGQTGQAYAWTAAKTVSAGLPEQLTSQRSPYRWTSSISSSVVGTAISSVDRTYAWFSNGMVGRGYTSNPTALQTYAYALPGGRQPSDIVGIAIRKSNDQTHAYYDDGTYSRGSTSAPFRRASSRPTSSAWTSIPAIDSSPGTTTGRTVSGRRGTSTGIRHLAATRGTEFSPASGQPMLRP